MGNCISLLRDIKYKYSAKKVCGFHVFANLLVKANEQDSLINGIWVKRGQLIIGRKSFSKEIGISEQSLRTCLLRLKSTNDITTESTNINTLVTIVNYEQYAIGKPKSTNNATTIKPKKIPIDEPNKNEYFENSELNQSFIDWIDMRIKIKKGPTDKAIKMAITKLSKMVDNDEDRKTIIDYSTFKNYTDFYKNALTQNNVNGTTETDTSFRESFLERASKNSY